MPGRKRVLFIQYHGDLRAAYHDFKAGAEETYFAQRYTVDAVERVGRDHGDVGTLIYCTESRFEEVLPNGVEVIGMGNRTHVRDFSEIVRRIDEWKPTHVVQRCISPDVLDWLSRRPIRTLALVAEILSKPGVRQWWRNRRLARILNRPGIGWVGNHGVSAAEWLRDIGVKPEKVVPYDYVYPVTPDRYGEKSLRSDGTPWRIAFVGMLRDGKGVGDLLNAAKILKDSGREFRLEIAGVGRLEHYKAMAESLGIAGWVEFLGLITNTRVIEVMRGADVAVVPSRHDYSESFGFVVQEAFIGRTPVIASDHRAFRKRVVDGETGLIVPAKNPAALARRICELMTDAGLYGRLSRNAGTYWDRLQLPVKWADVISRWLEESPASEGWLAEKTLATGLYEERSVAARA